MIPDYLSPVINRQLFHKKNVAAKPVNRPQLLENIIVIKKNFFSQIHKPYLENLKIFLVETVPLAVVSPPPLPPPSSPLPPAVASPPFSSAFPPLACGTIPSPSPPVPAASSVVSLSLSPLPPRQAFSYGALPILPATIRLFVRLRPSLFLRRLLRRRCSSSPAPCLFALGLWSPSPLTPFAVASPEIDMKDFTRKTALGSIRNDTNSSRHGLTMDWFNTAEICTLPLQQLKSFRKRNSVNNSSWLRWRLMKLHSNGKGIIFKVWAR